MGIRVNPNRTWPRMPPIFGGLAMLVSAGVLLASCGGGRQLIGLAVQPTDAVAFLPGGTFPFSATGTFDQSPTTQTNLPAQWASSDPSVATIDPGTGLATCLVVGGPVTITASAAGKGGSVKGSGTLTCQNSQAGFCTVFSRVGNPLSGFCQSLGGFPCQGADDTVNCPAGQRAIDPVFANSGCGLIRVDTARPCNP